MLNKDNYIPWSSRLLCYAKSKPNGKLIYNFIMHGLYVKRMIPEPGNPDREVPIAKTFHEQTDEELIEKEVKKMEADDQAILIIPMGLPEDIYVVVDSCETAQVEVNELRAEQLARAHDPLELMANFNNPYNYLVFHQDQPSLVTYMQQQQPNKNFNPQPSFNTNYMQQPMLNSENITDPTIVMNMALVLMAKAFKLNHSIPTNNNQRISSNPHNRQMQMVGGNGGNQFRQYAGQNVGNQNGYNAIQTVENQNLNPNGNGNVVAARAEGNAIGNNGNQIRCYNCRGLGHLARNCTVGPRKWEATFLQTQLLIARKEEAEIQF
ncbi:integrase, catalytic region, zinc finger, CCHC-type containing protein [Tanacetum coccineum]|uniref:Integrase, catalytic region, zinc finger, CCHC-type containing protein n=1 Tax=Tanacetum coccineum TaxID=301880 RepID=A0ABQ5F010_9ASTR